MEIPKNITDAYQLYASKAGEPHLKFPFGTRPDNFGGIHLEIKPNGVMALVGTDRGQETQRQETQSVDELLYWVFKSHVNSKAFYRPQQQYDFAASQRLAVEEIGKFSLEWQKRLRREQQNLKGP